MGLVCTECHIITGDHHIWCPNHESNISLREEFSDQIAALTEERDAARAQVETLVKALEWYDGATRYSSCGSECCLDNGDIARAALKAIEG